MEPVRLKSIVMTSEHHSDIISMVFRRVEVSIITDLNRHAHLDIFAIKAIIIFKAHFLKFIVTHGENLLKSDSDFVPIVFALTNKLIQSRFIENV